MPARTGFDPVGDDELLYRRIPQQWYSPKTGLTRDVFYPHPTRDKTGLSVWRADLISIEEAAEGRPGKFYYIGVLRASDLRKYGIEITPSPLPDAPGHAELSNINSDNRKSDETTRRRLQMAELCLEICGPFPTPE